MAECIQTLEKELADIRAESDAMRAKWQSEKDTIANLGSLKQQIEDIYLESAAEIDALLDEYGVPRVAASSPPMPREDDDD